jgi:hypothetical protein
MYHALVLAPQAKQHNTARERDENPYFRSEKMSNHQPLQSSEDWKPSLPLRRGLPSWRIPLASGLAGRCRCLSALLAEPVYSRGSTAFRQKICPILRHNSQDCIFLEIYIAHRCCDDLSSEIRPQRADVGGNTQCLGRLLDAVA